MFAIAIGVGAIATILSLASSVLFSHLPSTIASRLILYTMQNATGSTIGLTNGEIRALQARVRTVSGIAAWTDEKLPINFDESARSANVEFVTSNIFELTGVKLARGTLGAGFEFHKSYVLPAIVSSRLAERMNGSSDDVLGKAITIAKTPAEIVGILPSSFDGFMADSNTELLLPIDSLDLFRGHGYIEDPSNFAFYGIGPIAHPFHMESVIAETHALEPEVRRDADPSGLFMNQFFKDYRLVVSSGSAGYSWTRLRFAGAIRALITLTVAFMILCFVNISLVMAARLAEREAEISLQLALGAPSHQIVTDVITETMLMTVAPSVLGALSGSVVSHILAGAINTLSPLPVPSSIHWNLLAGVIIAAVACSVAAGCWPAWRAIQHFRHKGLNLEGRGIARVRRGGGWLLGAQGALSIILASLSIALLSSLYRVIRHNWGMNFKATAVATVDLTPALQGANSPPRVAPLLIDTLDTAIGVTASGISDLSPLTGDLPASRYFGVDRFGSIHSEPRTLSIRVTPGYFAAVGTQVVQGRIPELPVGRQCVISKNLSETLFPREDPVGKQIFPSTWNVPDGGNRDPSIACQIVGVVQDARFTRLNADAPPLMYSLISRQQFSATHFTVIVRGATEDVAFKNLQNALVAVLPSSAIVRESLFAWLRNADLVKESALAMVSTSFAFLALLLVSLGCSALLLHRYTTLKYELVIRSVFGAGRLNLMSLFIGQQLFQLGIGVAAGTLIIATVIPLSNSIGQLGFSVGFKDYCVALVFVTVSAGAAIIAPAHKINALSHSDALRRES